MLWSPKMILEYSRLSYPYNSDSSKYELFNTLLGPLIVDM